MRYIDAGYAAALGTLFLYGVSLVVRRHRLGRLAARVPELMQPEPGFPDPGFQDSRFHDQATEQDR